MIPLRLELKNFMSYGEDAPALDFSGMRTICLSGDNGHGKSALLDAMTWSLWGESRAGKNKHDELVRLGADEMSVSFTFSMDSAIYRVLRKRSKKVSGNQWELQQQAPDGLWHSQTGNSAGETEAAIQRLLRMSYETFVNSAYLRQGQADQFVRQPPGKRKEILSEILDLSRYDQMEAKARERSRSLAAEATDFERDINLMDAELVHEDGYQQTAQISMQKCEELLRQREILKGEWEMARGEKILAEAQRQQAQTLAQQIAALEQELTELEKEVIAAGTEAELAEGLVAQQETIVQAYQRFLACRDRLEGLRAAMETWHEQQKLFASVEKEWLILENEKKQRAAQAQQDYQQALHRLRDLPLLRRQREEQRQQVDSAAALVTEKAALTSAFDAHNVIFQELRVEKGRREEQARLWDERLENLQNQRGVCSVCNSPLPPEKLEATAQEYRAQAKSIKTQIQKINSEGVGIKKELAARKASIDEIEKRLLQASDVKVRFGQIEQSLFELSAVESNLANLKGAAEEAQRVFDEKKFAPDVLLRLDKLRKDIAATDGVPAQYNAARAQAGELANAERQYLALGHAQTTLLAAQERQKRASGYRKARQDSRALLQVNLLELGGFAEKIVQIDAALESVKHREGERSAEERATTELLIRAEQSLAHCHQLKARRAQTEIDFQKTRKEQEIYEQLSRACGKKGVQALIIDNAIPELQEEANRLLERLTDGDMSLVFSTLREAKTKKTGPIETLDIHVSDSLGTRPLEMYSGGEGFRAAFAIRIALSKLLSRRAGARLQTLIIDEGFGTQDGKGREKLVDAVKVIEEEFEKIIVITHIDELKDSFPSRIEVTKTPSGSHFTVLEGAAW